MDPYRLALANGGLYLVAWVPHYDAFRTFAVERVERLSVTDDTEQAVLQTRKTVEDLVKLADELTRSLSRFKLAA